MFYCDEGTDVNELLVLMTTESLSNFCIVKVIPLKTKNCVLKENNLYDIMYR